MGIISHILFVVSDQIIQVTLLPEDNYKDRSGSEGEVSSKEKEKVSSM
ncbi:hypothetical protein KJ652_03950 [Patescibacteria group bacterium]|nr:hypothetical protein [Patescibacteria group bacterium]MBU1123718.1 hypothetical protein [Patescibacteria group bacterium]MBU1911419.1 hypothetical protein [Patescibacteria group bacterium]